MEIGPEKKKRTHNPDGFQREIKITGQRLEEVKSFKHLGSKPEILSRIAQAQFCKGQ